MFNFLHKLFSAKSSSQTTDNTICSKSTSTSSTTNEKKHQKFYSRLGFEKSDFLVPMLKKI